MASLFRPLQRCLMPIKQLNKLSVSATAMRFKSDSTPVAPTSPQKGLDANVNKVDVDLSADPKQSYFPDPWDLLDGAERFEIAMKTKGFADPYDTEPLAINRNSTKATPNVVYSLENHRVVGCICEEDTHHINYMHLTMNETKRCECGHWFTLKERQMPDLSDYGITWADEGAHGHH